MTHVELWTDGSGSTGEKPAGWAFLLRYVADDGSSRELLNGGPLVQATNNRAELTAAIEGLRALKRSCSLTVCTDSEYVMKGFTDGRVAKWHANGWITGSGSKAKPVANQDLWLELEAEVAKHDVAWRHVRGHVGIEHNELVDQVAGIMRSRAIFDRNENDPPTGNQDGSLESHELRGAAV